jgi:hypothetical protein
MEFNRVLISSNDRLYWRPITSRMRCLILIGKIQRFVVKYDLEYRPLQKMKTWLLDFKKRWGDGVCD